MTNAEAWFSKIHIRKVYACLAVTCHLHFLHNVDDREYVYIYMYIMASLLIGKWWLVHGMYILKVVIFFVFVCT